jgi:hypothetical protein
MYDEENRENPGPKTFGFGEAFAGMGWLIKALIIGGVVFFIVSVLLQVIPDIADDASRGISRGLRPIFSGRPEERLLKTGFFIIFIVWIIKRFTRNGD